MKKISQNTAHFRRTKGAAATMMVAAGGIAVGALILTAPTAAATTGQTVCQQMGGSYNSKTASNGKTVESCAVESGGGPVVGYWINGKWQGAY